MPQIRRLTKDSSLLVDFLNDPYCCQLLKTVDLDAHELDLLRPDINKQLKAGNKSGYEVTNRNLFHYKNNPNGLCCTNPTILKIMDLKKDNMNPTSTSRACINQHYNHYQQKQHQ